MEVTIYAPVIIPTLNRYSHLKRCVDSLSKCLHADKTELIISLDAPPSEKYLDGYNLIKSYLPTITAFKKVTVFKQEKNLGANGNIDFLLNYVTNEFDTFIFTEDDNVFSKNFLDYINKGLKKFKDNRKIYAICGYNYPVNMNGYTFNYYFTHDMPAWGYGSWSDKYKEVNSIITKPSFFYDVYSSYPLKKYFKDNLKLMRGACRLGDGFLGDVYTTMYLNAQDMFTVLPSISKVRNLGHDGTGANCGKLGLHDFNPYDSQVIDDDSLFDFDENVDLCINKKIRKLTDIFRGYGVRSNIKTFVLFSLLYIYLKIK